jgi:hypothetical protein
MIAFGSGFQAGLAMCGHSSKSIMTCTMGTGTRRGVWTA